MSKFTLDRTVLVSKGGDQVHEVRKELQKAHLKFARISPVRSVKSLDQGDVVISKSGNIRLVVSVQDQESGPVVCFLTKHKDGQLRLENALIQKIDVDRIESVILKRNGNPLNPVSSFLKNLDKNTALLRNTQTLLKTGSLGEELERKLLLQRRNQDGAMLTLHVREHDGLIVAIGARAPKDGERRIAVGFNYEGNAFEEYIKEANFYARTPVSVKELLVTCCIVANCIENARILEQKSQYIHTALGSAAEARAL